MSPVALVLAASIVTLSAWLQASVGFGYALVAAPVLALVSDELVPGPVIVSSFVLSAASAWRERRHIDRRGIGLALVGRVPGALIAGAALHWLSPSRMNVVFGVTVLVAVALSVSGLRVLPSMRALLLAGLASGMMGTTTSIGGPPIAIVYQHAEGPTLRSTLNGYFALGSLMSLSVLSWAGRFGTKELVAGAALLPAAGLGFLLSSRTRAHLDAGRTRSAVLLVASLAALGVVLKTLLG